MLDKCKLMVAEAGQYEPCMMRDVDEDGGRVELRTDTRASVYFEHINGEQGNIGLLRCRRTNRLVGIWLPLRRHNLCVFHEGPIRINAGFRRSDV